MGNEIVRERVYREIALGHTEEVQKLLERSPELKDEELTKDCLRTPLLQAIFHQHIEMVYMLLQHGCDATRANSQGITPLMMSAIKDNLQICSLLLSRPNMPIDVEDPQGITALDYAVLYGHYETAQMIYKYKHQELKQAIFYNKIQQQNHTRYVKHDVLIMSLVKGFNLEALPDFLHPVKPCYRDPVVDPREGWKQFFRRLGNFEKPPMVERSQLPQDLRPENRNILSRVRTMIELGRSEAKRESCQQLGKKPLDTQLYLTPTETIRNQ